MSTDNIRTLPPLWYSIWLPYVDNDLLLKGAYILRIPTLGVPRAEVELDVSLHPDRHLVIWMSRDAIPRMQINWWNGRLVRIPHSNPDASKMPMYEPVSVRNRRLRRARGKVSDNCKFATPTL